jgi:hypothetical protein
MVFSSKLDLFWTTSLFLYFLSCFFFNIKTENLKRCYFLLFFIFSCQNRMKAFNRNSLKLAAAKSKKRFCVGGCSHWHSKQRRFWLGATTFSIMPSSITTFIIETFKIMPLSTMPLSTMPLGTKPLSTMSLSTMSLNRLNLIATLSINDNKQKH